jgi:hypothetical protein
MPPARDVGASVPPRLGASRRALLRPNPGGHGGIAVATLMSSPLAAIAAVVAYFLFGERLGRIQLEGVIGVVAGVPLLSAVRA